MTRGRRSGALAPMMLPLAIVLALPWSALAASKAPPPPAPGVAVRNADGWLAQPPGKERDRIVLAWLPTVTLPELIWLLRRDPAELGALERPIVERALERTPRDRAALRRWLLARLIAIDPALAKRAGTIPEVVRAARLPPRASAFRIGLLGAPAGDYAEATSALRAGLDAGLRSRSPGALADGAHPPEITLRDAGDPDPSRRVAGLDSAFAREGILVVGSPGVEAEPIVAAAHVAGVPLVLCGSNEEVLGAVGPGVFQIGPSGAARGASLARALELAGKRVGILASSQSPASFAQGFADTAVAAGAEVAWRETYESGAVGFRSESHEIADRKLDLVFWDGEPREIDGLLRQLAHDKVKVRIVGGAGLAPELHHAETRPLLDGAVYVDDDWSPRGAAAEALAHAPGHATGPEFLRGWLAGRAILDALSSGALCPEELEEALVRHRARGDDLASHGFIDFGEAVEIPVVAVPGRQGH